MTVYNQGHPGSMHTGRKTGSKADRSKKTPKPLCTTPNNCTNSIHHIYPTRTGGIRSKNSRNQWEKEMRRMRIIESHYRSLLGQVPWSPSNACTVLRAQVPQGTQETKENIMVAINLKSLQQEKDKEKRTEYRGNVERTRSEPNENTHPMRNTIMPWL